MGRLEHARVGADTLGATFSHGYKGLGVSNLTAILRRALRSVPERLPFLLPTAASISIGL